MPNTVRSVTRELNLRQGSGAAASPRLSLGHLLLWAACCAAYLAVFRQLAQQQPTVSGMLLIVVATTIDGTALAGLAIFVTRRIRDVRWEIEPGEWLLAIVGARLVAYLLLETWLARAVTSRSNVLAAFTCFLLVMPLLSRKLPTLWKVFFALLVLAYLWPMLTVCLSIWFQLEIDFLDTTARIMQISTVWVFASLVLIVGFLDLREVRSRTWLHWIGLAGCLATLISSRILPHAF